MSVESAPDRPSGGLLRRTLVSVVLIGVLLAAGAAGFRKFATQFAPPPRTPGGAPLPVVRVEALREQAYVETIRSYGVGRVLREARVAAEVVGVVREVSPLLRVGARVGTPTAEGNGGPGNDGPGDGAPVLIRIDGRDLEDAIARLAAQRKQLQAERARVETVAASLEHQLGVAARRLATTRDELHRIEELVRQDTLAESDGDRQRLAVFALEQMESELASRRDQTATERATFDAQLEVNAVLTRQAARDLTRTRVHAPFSGIVAERLVEVGSRVAPGTPLFDLVDPSRVEVGLALPAGQYGRVGRGSPVSLHLRPDGETVWAGTVLRVDPAIDAASRTFRVWVEVPGDLVPPGAPVIGDLTGPRHEGVLAVPREAFLGRSVYVAVPTGVQGEAVARRRVPRVAALLPSVALVVPSADETGLAHGDVVVVSNLEDIAEGSEIKVVPATTGDLPR